MIFRLVRHTVLAVTAGLLSVGTVVAAERMNLQVTPVRGILKADEKVTTWVRVGLTGFEMQAEKERPPVNLAIVLDKSGSMGGEKIEQARAAAVDAIRLLKPTDIVSIITYDSTVDVLVPATRLADPESVIAKIRTIQAGGNTALFAGVSKAAAEVRKFLDKEYVNRVILLSDGLANVGPSSPGELRSLGATLMEESISVSTLGLGLGYNEDLMVGLAGAGGGNHQFIETATELADVFRREFDDVLNVVAQEIELKVKLPEGIRPVRVLGNEAEIAGQEVFARLAQVYSLQERFVLLEVEVPATEAGEKVRLSNVSVTYRNMKTGDTDQLEASAKVVSSSDEAAVEASLDAAVMADVVALISSEQSKLATKLLDSGDLALCRTTLTDNVAWLKTNAEMLQCDGLNKLAEENQVQLRLLETAASKESPSANIVRKRFRAFQYGVDNQQRGSVGGSSASGSAPASGGGSGN